MARTPSATDAYRKCESHYAKRIKAVDWGTATCSVPDITAPSVSGGF